MQFIVKKTCSGNARIGALSGLAKLPETVIETPTLALLTQGGSVVHLTAEVFSKVFKDPQLLWMPLCNSIQLEKGVCAQGQGVAKFAGLPKHIFCATLNNFNEATPSGHLEAETVPLWTKQGKKMISAERYMDVMETLKPDIILAIADNNIALSDGSKRISKSVDRTCNMLQKCVQRYKNSKELRDSALIGVIVGAAEEKRCDNCIQRVLAHKDVLSGVALSGLTDGSDASYFTPVNVLDKVFERVANNIPNDLVRIVEGCWNPVVILSAIKHGWDLFDGSYAVRLTNSGRALVLKYDLNQYADEMCILNLNDVRYKDDFRPILEGCECLTCTKHTRAYVRHLLNTREMLASVLLSIHNLHHFDQFFRHIRQHITADTFTAFEKIITKQYEDYLSTYHEEDIEEIDEVKKKDTPVKKKRVSNVDIPVNLVNGSCS